MKFTNGFWLMKENITPLFAVEYAGSERRGNDLVVYTFLYNQTVFSLLEKEKGENEAVVFARSATVGGQQFPVHWGGDSSASYPSMAETLRGGLSLACAGFGYWSHDIGGFEETAPADVYKRWCAFGLLSSHSRLHGSTSYRVPWLFDEEACEVLSRFTKLKCRLMPYIFTEAIKTHLTGVPMMRPMFVEFPKEKACETLDKQYMLGDSLLVAPVFKTSGEVDYYLPEGRWVNLLDQEVIVGGEWKKEIHSVKSLPLMVRPNTILAIGASDSQVDYDYKKDLELLFSCFEDGADAVLELRNVKGDIILSVKAECRGEYIYVYLDDERKEIRLNTLGKQNNLQIIRK